MSLVQRWQSLDPCEDGPFLALNLMRYRPRAEYADGRATTLTGREADDIYTPLGPLAAVGGRLIFAADVVEQPAGEPGFHRVAIVRYPTRASFLEMERRADFRELHVHKDAGMDFTIILAAAPPDLAPGAERRGMLLLRLRAAGCSYAPAATAAAQPLLRLVAEDVVIGDERRWEEARLEEVDGAHETWGEGEIAMLLSPLYDELALAVGAAS